MALVLVPPTDGGVRQSDDFGNGLFRAPRGERLHRGLDFLCPPGGAVSSPTTGAIRRIGWCYADDPSYRLIEIEAPGAWVRILYVAPEVEVGAQVAPGDVLGRAQDVAARYGPGMLNHVHLEVQLTTGLVGR